MKYPDYAAWVEVQFVVVRRWYRKLMRKSCSDLVWVEFDSGLLPSATFRNSSRLNSDGQGANSFHGPGFPGLKKRSHTHGSRSWIKIDQSGNSKILELDKATVMRQCSLKLMRVSCVFIVVVESR